jgi:hypothetical protein
MWECGMWNVECDMLVCGMWYVGMWYVDMWYVVCWRWYVGIVIGIENVDVLVNFFGKSQKWTRKSTIRKKYDCIETLKVWSYNM